MSSMTIWVHEKTPLRLVVAFRLGRRRGVTPWSWRVLHTLRLAKYPSPQSMSISGWSALLSATAREIVSRGVSEGLGSDAVARQLQRAFRGQLAGRTTSYYGVVANAFSNRARSFSQLVTMRDAGIDTYTIEAVLDERTTNICRGLHGKTLQVSRTLTTFDEVEKLEDPAAIKRAQPWFVEKLIGSGPDAGKRGLFLPGKGGSRLAAVVDRSGVGRSDVVGSIRWGMSNKSLQNQGVGSPPYHGNCRTTLLPDV